MNRALPLGIAALGLAASVGLAQAQFSFTTNDAAITITGYTGPGGSVSIPNIITGLPVAGIGQSAFAYCSSLTNVTIPNGVTSIGDCAFEACSNLTGIAISDTVTSIGGLAFRFCSSLASLSIPNSVTNIGNEAFRGCSSLTNVIIPQPKPQPPAHPFVEEMLKNIQPANLYCMIRQITGEEPVVVGHEAVVFTNRFTGSAPLRKATQFAFEQLQALGLQVQYQDWERAWQSWPTYSDRNIIAIQSGFSRPEEIVVICAHYDDYSETDRAPGADDNGSGSSAILTAARIFSRYHFDRTIHYVLFTGEEQHGLGSQEYVSRAVAGGSNIVAVLAPDMIGYASSALEPPTCSLWTWYVPYFGLEGPIGSELAKMFTLGFEVEAMFTNVVAVYSLTNTLSCSFAHPIMWGIPSDAEFFFENGYPTLLPTHAHENSRYHSAEDTLSSLNPSYFTAMVQAIVGTAAHLAVPVERNPFEVIELVNSDWTPGSGLGGSRFCARLAPGASETTLDSQDLAWSDISKDSAFDQELQLYTDPYGVALQTDARPADRDALFRVKLKATKATTGGVSGNTRLRFSFLTPPDTNRVYLARVHVDGRHSAANKDFDCVTNLQEVVSAGGFLDLPPLIQVPERAVYGTCDIAVRFLKTEPANCRLRITEASERSVTLTATAQLGAQIIDALEVCTNLDSGKDWTLVKSCTNYVSPDAAHFDTGWTEIARDVDLSRLPAARTQFFRLKRTWIQP